MDLTDHLLDALPRALVHSLADLDCTAQVPSLMGTGTFPPNLGLQLGKLDFRRPDRALFLSNLSINAQELFPNLVPGSLLLAEILLRALVS
jgi:hypothetical protein